MPAKDMSRWQLNEDGSYSRLIGALDDTDEINATASAIDAADEWGIDISTITGTGHEGRVTKADIEQAHAETEEA